LEKSDEIKLLDKSDYEPSEKSEKSFDKSGDKSVDKSEETGLVMRSHLTSLDRVKTSSHPSQQLHQSVCYF